MATNKKLLNKKIKKAEVELNALLDQMELHYCGCTECAFMMTRKQELESFLHSTKAGASIAKTT